jgi:hypothetical protein
MPSMDGWKKLHGTDGWTGHAMPSMDGWGDGWMDGSLANCLHKQKFVLLLVDGPSDIMWACFCSCVGLGVGTWLLARPTTLTFHLSSSHFFIILHTHLGLPHPIIPHISWF